MKGIKDSYSINFSQLLGNGLKYIVPKFQRDYSWDTEQWDDMWQDFQQIFNNGEDHYMGYLVLLTEDNKEFNVIDGQQRLTTLSIIILTVINNLKKLIEKGFEPEENKTRKNALHETFIGSLDLITLIPHNKLVLNRNNDSFYKNYLTSYQKLPQRGLNSSERLMKKCYEWFDKKIETNYNEGTKLARFVESITRNIYFTVIKVTDNLNAYKVFETLNARGVKLSSADLLKNYLFQVIDNEGSHELEFKQLEDLWGKIIDKLGNELLPEFLRTYWNSRNKTTRKNELYKTIRNKISKKQQVFELIRDLNEKADIYIALNNPQDEFWKEMPKTRTLLTELQLFGVKQPISLLLIGYEKLNRDNFEKLLSHCVNLSFRYNTIGGLNPNEQEDAYNKIALSIFENNNYNTNQFFSIYPDDKSFEADFANVEFKSTSRNHKIVKYIFSKIEKQSSGVEFDYTSEINTVEHILPEHPDENWEITDEIIERSIYKLGNLTVLERNLNKEAENKSFELKRAIYEKSNFYVTKDITENFEDWNEEQIIKRQRDLAKYAKSIWKIQF